MTLVTGRDAIDRPDAELARALHGQLVTPRDDAYDQYRRVWNGSIDRRPALIARCTCVDDVRSALRFARRHGLRVAVRGGGHSFPGHSVCDGGLVIDLSPMKDIVVDPEARTVRVQAGVLLGELDRQTQPFGLAVPSGIVTHTGIAGLTLGGGIGWTMRKYGLTIDNLLSAEMVTADGGVVTASASREPDLFWGLRVGGGNFGVVTGFEFRLQPVGPQVVAGPVFWPIEQAPGLLRFYRDWIAECPDELMTLVVQRKAPALPIIPTDVVGKPVVAVVACYTGPVADGERVLRPLKSWGKPLLDLCEPKEYLAHQSMFDPSFPHGWWYYIQACDIGELSDDVIDIAVEHGRKVQSPVSSAGLWQRGGAVARIADDATAFHGRRAAFTFNINGNSYTEEGFAAERDWARAYWSALAPFHTSVYVNFLMAEGQDRVRQAYGDAKYHRLQAVKNAYDPENVFRLNQNILPG